MHIDKHLELHCLSLIKKITHDFCAAFLCMRVSPSTSDREWVRIPSKPCIIDQCHWNIFLLHWSQSFFFKIYEGTDFWYLNPGTYFKKLKSNQKKSLTQSMKQIFFGDSNPLLMTTSTTTIAHTWDGFITFLLNFVIECNKCKYKCNIDGVRIASNGVLHKLRNTTLGGGGCQRFRYESYILILNLYGFTLLEGKRGQKSWKFTLRNLWMTPFYDNFHS